MNNCSNTEQNLSVALSRWLYTILFARFFSVYAYKILHPWKKAVKTLVTSEYLHTISFLDEADLIS